MSWGRLWRGAVDAYRRRPRVAWAVVVALLVVVAAQPAWRGRGGPAATGEVVAAADPSPRASGAARPIALPAAPDASGTAGAGLDLRAAQVLPQVPDTPPDRRYWDLCGVGRVPWPAGATQPPDALPEHLGSAAFKAGRTQLLQALAAGDERARVAGRILERYGDGEPGGYRRVLEQARGTRDGVVAAWAAATCASWSGCPSTALREWTALEPDNAAAWALWGASGHDPGQDLRPALQAASRYATYPGVLAQVVQKHLPTDLPGYVQAELLGRAMNLDGMLASTLTTPAFWVCREPGTPASAPLPPPGSAQAQVCERMARLLVDRQDTMMANRVAIRLAELAGWSAQAVRQLEAERSLIGQYVLPPGASEDQPRSCGTLQAMRQQVDDTVRLGEVGMLRARAAAASGPQPGR